MLCANGKEMIPTGENTIMLICQREENKDGFCRFSRFCNQTKKIEMITDKFGRTCKNFKTNNI
jgi:hypothetical protein